LPHAAIDSVMAMENTIRFIPTSPHSIFQI
jgi:hypothetical protein